MRFCVRAIDVCIYYKNYYYKSNRYHQINKFFFYFFQNHRKIIEKIFKIVFVFFCYYIVC